VSVPRHHTVQVPATTANLGAGFDAFGLALDLYLTVRTVPRDGRSERVRTDGGTGCHALATDEGNLVWRAFVAFCEHHHVEVPDVAMVARCEVPLERGLGSSSAAIVAGLTLARALTGVVIGDRELISQAARLEGHPDNVAPALLGGLVACAVDDAGSVVVRRVNPAPHLRPIALVPTASMATTAARAVLPESLPRAEVAEQAARAGHVLAALSGTWPMAVGLAGDRLHEPARLAVMGPSGEVVAALREQGIHAWLSGAGPSVMAAVPAVSASPEPSDGPVDEVARAHGFVSHARRFDLAGALICPDDGCGLSGSGGCVQCPRGRLS
jgi:homoserine kinase